jgi:hypothetical protein
MAPPAFVEEISASDPDLVAVTESREGSGIGLCAALKEHGVVYAATTNLTSPARRAAT